MLVDLRCPVRTVLRHLDCGGVVSEARGVTVGVRLGDDAGGGYTVEFLDIVGLGVGDVADRPLHLGDLVMVLTRTPCLPGVTKGGGLPRGIGHRAQGPDILVVGAMRFVDQVHLPARLVGHPHQVGIAPISW